MFLYNVVVQFILGSNFLSFLFLSFFFFFFFGGGGGGGGGGMVMYDNEFKTKKNKI